jgi:hypothetical protein
MSITGLLSRYFNHERCYMNVVCTITSLTIGPWIGIQIAFLLLKMERVNILIMTQKTMVGTDHYFNIGS